jgi:hypothetical protein
MDRNDADRLWLHVQSLLRAPPPPGSADLGRAARMLASARADAVELLLAQWLAQTRGQTALDPPALPGSSTEGQAAVAPAARHKGIGVREAVLVTAGVAAGALLADALGEEPGLDLG